MKKRLLITDMDYTLLNRNAQVGEANMEAIRRHVAAGGLFTVATGRAPAAICIYPELVELVNLPAIVGNGGMLCDLKTGEIFYQQTLPEAACALMGEALEAFSELGAVLYEGFNGFYRLRGNEHIDELIRRERRTPVDATAETAPRPWSKVLTAQERPYIVEVRAWLEPRLEGRGRLVYSEEHFLELLPAQVSKGDALRVLMDRFGLSPEEVVAVGDAPNDREMLQTAGVGVAVGNAEADLRAEADAVVCDHDGPAIAEVLERFF